MLVEDEPLAEELERRGERPVRVRRVARLDHVESLPAGAAKNEHERAKPAVGELPDVRERSPWRGRRRVLTDPDARNFLERRITRPLWADDGDLEARVPEREGLQPHAPVEGHGQVLNDDQDSPLCPRRSRATASPGEPLIPGHGLDVFPEPAVDVEHVLGRASSERADRSGSAVPTTATSASSSAAPGVGTSISRRCGSRLST